MPAWGLKVGSLLTTLLVLAGSYGYAGAHIKNPDAPLQPPVADKPLAAYFARRVRGLQRKLAQIRPKYADDLAAFESEHLGPLLTALGARNGPSFERIYAAATDKANELHVKWAKPYIRWVLPDEPPKDLDLELDR